MTYVTEILANESGIQYQGVKDKTGGTGTYPITGLITGKFRRGRFDKPMTITNANIRAMLGYDPKNPSYTAVQDALNSGVPSVQVLRLKGAGKVCIGATKKVILGAFSSGGYYDVKINNNLHAGVYGFRVGQEDLKYIFIQYGIVVTPLNSSLQEVIAVDGNYNNVAYAAFYNPTGTHVDIEITVTDASRVSQYIIDEAFGENETVNIVDSGSINVATFCLE